MSTTMTRESYLVELIAGREVEKPLPKKLHIWIQTYLIVKLSALLAERYMAMPELNVLTGGKTADGRREYIIPAVTVAPRSAAYSDGDLAEAPLLGVEILSPGQTIGDLFTRAERLLRLGCPMVWVVWPEKRKAWEYSMDPGRSAADRDYVLEEVQKQLTLRFLSGEGEAVSVNIPVAEMWAELDKK